MPDTWCCSLCKSEFSFEVDPVQAGGALVCYQCAKERAKGGAVEWLLRPRPAGTPLILVGCVLLIVFGFYYASTAGTQMRDEAVASYKGQHEVDRVRREYEASKGRTAMMFWMMPVVIAAGMAVNRLEDSTKSHR